jgi:membrane protease subunit HflK
MSLNDPQWGNRGNDNGGGKRPNQGPPDLEQLWRDLNRRCPAFSTRSVAGGDRR